MHCVAARPMVRPHFNQIPSCAHLAGEPAGECLGRRVIAQLEAVIPVRGRPAPVQQRRQPVRLVQQPRPPAPLLRLPNVTKLEGPVLEFLLLAQSAQRPFAAAPPASPPGAAAAAARPAPAPAHVGVNSEKSSGQHSVLCIICASLPRDDGCQKVRASLHHSVSAHCKPLCIMCSSASSRTRSPSCCACTHAINCHVDAHPYVECGACTP